MLGACSSPPGARFGDYNSFVRDENIFAEDESTFARGQNRLPALFYDEFRAHPIHDKFNHFIVFATEYEKTRSNILISRCANLIFQPSSSTNVLALKNTFPGVCPKEHLPDVRADRRDAWRVFIASRGSLRNLQQVRQRREKICRRREHVCQSPEQVASPFYEEFRAHPLHDKFNNFIVCATEKNELISCFRAVYILYFNLVHQLVCVH